LLDVKATGYIFNPINDELIVVRSFPDNVKTVLWDNSVTDKDVFVVLDNNNTLHTFIINPDDVEEGTYLVFLKIFKILKKKIDLKKN
jgi:hypothetical protein